MKRAAKDIYQEVLDRTDLALKEFDYDLVKNHVAVPYRMVTTKAAKTFDTAVEVKELFMTFSHAITTLGVDEFRRTAQECSYLDDTTILGHHMSYLIRDGEPMVTPYPSMMTLKLMDGYWKITEAQNAVENDSWPILMPLSPIKDTLGAPGRARRDELFQTILDRITKAFDDDDFDQWERCVALPFSLISSEGIEIYNTIEDLRRDFIKYQRDIETSAITQIVREARSTEMIGRDQMMGIYRTHFLRGHVPALDPWDSAITMRNDNGLWRVTSNTRQHSHLNWSVLSGRPNETIATPIKGDTK